MATVTFNRVAGFDRAMREALALLRDNPAGAVKQLRAITKDFPDQPVGYRGLAMALRQAGQKRSADEIDRKSVELSARQPSVVAALEAMAAERFEDAEVLIRAHLRQDPEDAGGARLLGEIAGRCGANAEAETLLRRAVQLAPGYLEARLQLAKLLNRVGRNADALAELDEILTRDEKQHGALTLKAAILVQDRALEKAHSVFKKLTRFYRGDAIGWLNFGYMLKTTGRIDESIAAYRKSVEYEPRRGIAWWGLANLKTIQFDADDVVAMRKARALPEISDDDRLHLDFALGKALGDQGDYAGSFEAYREGNTIRRAQSPHDAARVSDNVRNVEQVFTPDFFASRERWGSEARDPIFVVSLPRSGSTLIEQILASHPLIEGTEELYDIERIALELAPGLPSGSYLNELTSLSPAKLRSLGDHYVEATRRNRRTDRPFFTDKMPSNWVFTGLIHLILPHAKIIDIRRHPLSCGFANYSQHFNWGINFSYDLTDIGKFYTAYVRQMAHFERVLPGRVHHVVYEQLVDNFEVEVRRLLHYLELPFDDACLRFFDNPRAVHTPSAEQVRRPINRDGVERWLPYEPWLGPLKSSLGSVLDTYPDAPRDWPD